jgi:hypothetical protein
MKKQFTTKKLLEENRKKAEKAIIENFANSFNKIKRMDENPISQKFFYGDIKSIDSSCGYGKYKFICKDSYCEVEITTEKDGKPFLNMILCISIDVTSYDRGYAPHGWDPGDPGNLEFDIIINKGSIEDSSLEEPIEPSDEASEEEYEKYSDASDQYYENRSRKLTDEEIHMLQNDDFLMGKLYEKLDNDAQDKAEDDMRNYDPS